MLNGIRRVEDNGERSLAGDLARCGALGSRRTVSPSPELSVPAAIAELLRGRPLAVVDERGDGQVVVAGARVRATTISFMAVHACGPVSAAIAPERARLLALRSQPGRSGRPFLVSVEARKGVTTGISAADRALTIALLADPATAPPQLSTPGHVALIATDAAGVLGAPGVEEAAVDLARLAGLQPVAVVCPIMDGQGRPATGAAVRRFCAEHGLRLLRVGELITYRRCREEAVERVVETRLPTSAGDFRALGYRSLCSGEEHLALVCGQATGARGVPVRIQRHCVLGEALHARSCGCRAQLDAAMATIQAHGCGVIVQPAAHRVPGLAAHWPAAADAEVRGAAAGAGAGGRRGGMTAGDPTELAALRHENALVARMLADIGIASAVLLCASGERPRHLEPHGVAVAGILALDRQSRDIRFAQGASSA